MRLKASQKKAFSNVSEKKIDTWSPFKFTYHYRDFFIVSCIVCENQYLQNILPFRCVLLQIIEIEIEILRLWLKFLDTEIIQHESEIETKVYNKSKKLPVH